MQSAVQEHSQSDNLDIRSRYKQVREQSINLCSHLEVEDFELQADVFVSPIKWHLAHTSWFFETFILKPNAANYQEFHPQFEYLFNSYYNAVGQQFPRDKRGLMSRPTVTEVKAYREYVDQKLLSWLDQQSPLPSELYDLLILGLNHEQQHQELMLTDLKYNFSLNPLFPIYHKAKFPKDFSPNSQAEVTPLQFIEFGGGIYNFGHKGEGFAFDNESPRHQHLIKDFRLANRLITNAEYSEFIEDGGYQNPLLWLSDGWSWLQQNAITTPLYWFKEQDDNSTSQHRFEFRLTGYGKLHPEQPVTHVSFYEADAFARWAGKRLPNEYEWEVASKKYQQNAHFADQQLFHPQAADPALANELQQLLGDCWEWTQSTYSPYPGYKPAAGAVGEYNGKFMCNQMVLRGGSCATPANHVRSTYRNFFYPQDCWQFTGIRLAEDV